MKTIFIIVVCLFSYSLMKSQNLVPNPSFEIYDTCPNSLSQITYAVGWYNVSSTPDYFNACDLTHPDVEVPLNFWGYQYPASGNGYAGFPAKYGTSGVREYLGTTLASPLQIGTKYFINLKVSLAAGNGTDYCAVNKLGVLFSTLNYINSNMLPCNCSQIYTNTIITDTTNWTRIRGSFIADSIYSYISIGNFFTDSLTTSIQISGNSQVAYYYVDDICVSTDSAYTYNYNWTGIEEISNHPTISIYPNPGVDYVNIDFASLNEPYSITIYDVFGRELFFKQKIFETLEKIPIGNINGGVLIIKIIYKNQTLNFKLIKI